jgi:peptidoglycan hydrolase-like protein with peptidoglycan-binding domain
MRLGNTQFGLTRFLAPIAAGAARVLLGGALLAGAPPAAAQGAPPAPAATRPADPLFAVAEKAFLALDIEARRAIQRDLVWAGGFSGSATGDFGPLTFAALKRFEAEAKLKADGILAPPERAALQKAADQARAATRFEIVSDAASGIRLGLPQIVFTKSAPNGSGGTRFQDRDEKVTLETIIYRPEDTLPDLFAKGVADRPGRRITYKLLKPDFFVISGETAGGKFYRRVDSDGKAMRGLSIGYDKALAPAFDRMVIAIAASFEPFPKAGGARPAPGPGPAPVAAAPRQRRATGLVIAPETIVTAEAALKGCAEIVALGPKGERIPARIARGAGPGLVLLAAKTGAPLKAGLAPPQPGAATLLQREADGALAASAAVLAEGRAEASLQEGGAGAPLFDREGRLVAVIAAEPVTKYRVAGIVPAQFYAFVPAPDIAAAAGLASAGAPAPAALSGAAIAEAARASLVGLLCASDR